MSVDKKEYELEGSGPAAAEDSDAAEGAPRRKKRTGLRVPSDNVPRPEGARRTLPPVEGTPVAATPASAPLPPSDGVPEIVTIMPARPATAPPVASAPVPVPVPVPAPMSRAMTEDLEVDLEMFDEDAGGAQIVPVRSAAEATPEPSRAPAPIAAAAVPWSPPPESPTEEIAEDEMPGEATQIGPPPGASVEASPAPAVAASPAVAPVPEAVPAPQVSPASSGPTPAALAAAFTALPRAASESGPAPQPATALPAPVAAAAVPAPMPTAALDEPRPAPATEPAAPQAAATTPDAEEERDDDAEELAPSEFEEVESGPTPSSVATAGVPAAQPTPVAEAPVQAAPAPGPAATAAASAAAAAPAARPSHPPPPPAPQAKSPPSPPPAPKAAAAAVAAAAAKAPVAQPVAAQAPAKKRKGKAWYEEIFDEDYLRTLPFLTPQATQREAAFIAESLQLRPGMQVLDLGCGYGRHAMELAARGYHVVGLDLSLPLLIRGADEAQRRSLTINFVHGDMRELTFDAQFDGAYCVFSTFGFFDDETNKRVAQNLSRALKPGARLVIDILNRDYVISDLPTRVWWEGDGCVVLEEVDFNYFTSRVISNRSVVFEDGRQLEQEISLRAYSLHELGKLLHGAGFRVLEVSGGLSTRGRFFGSTSRQIIVVAEKRSDSGSSSPTSPPPDVTR